MPPALFARYTGRVLPEWIDYNGHMNLAYYVLAFDQGTDCLLDELGLGADYRRTANHSMYALEIHVTYERELKAGDPIAVETQLLDADERRLHFFHRMKHAGEGFLAATNELVALHVDLTGPRAAPFPSAAAEKIAAMLAGHRKLPRPPQAGRVIGLRKPPA